jgi:hypothetical protein
MRNTNEGCSRRFEFGERGNGGEEGGPGEVEGGNMEKWGEEKEVGGGVGAKKRM